MNSLEQQLVSPDQHVATDVSTAVADVLAERTDHLFGPMGNGNAHLISRLTSAGFGFASARHEAATVAMADAYHRATGPLTEQVALDPLPGKPARNAPAGGFTRDHRLETARQADVVLVAGRSSITVVSPKSIRKFSMCTSASVIAAPLS